MLFPEWDNDYKWQIYSAIGETVKAVFFLLLLTHVPDRLKPLMLCGAVWYTTQAQQEFVGLNDGKTETWEYWLVALMAAAIVVQLRMTRR